MKVDTLSIRLMMTLQHVITSLAMVTIYVDDPDRLITEITDIRRTVEQIVERYLKEMESECK